MRAKKPMRLAINVNVAAEKTPRAAAAPLAVERLGARLDAEMRGLDLTAPQRRRMERTAVAGDAPY